MDQQIIEPTNKGNRILFMIIIIFLTTAIVGGAIYYAMGNQVELQSNKITDLENKVEAYSIEEVQKATISELNIVVGGGISEDNLKFIKENIVDTVGNVPFVKDTQNKNIIYFIAEKSEQKSFEGQPEYYGGSSITPKVYSLNLLTQEIKEIFKAKQDVFYYHLAGIKDNKLLFQKINQMDTPGVCADLWELAVTAENNKNNKDNERTIQALDLTNTSAGFTYFAVPKYKYEKSKVKADACVKRLKASLNN